LRVLRFLARFAEWDRRVVDGRRGGNWPSWLLIGVGTVFLYFVVHFGVEQYRCKEYCRAQGLEILYYLPEFSGGYDGAHHPAECRCRTGQTADGQPRVVRSPPFS
jgi:hypothetical protein